MKKTDWKYLVDVTMFLSMVGIILIGLLLAFVLEEGPAVQESQKIFLGLHRHQWSHIHLYLSLAFTGLLALHLILEWTWIKGKTQKVFKQSWRTALYMIVAAAVLIPFVFWLFSNKNDPEYLKYGFGQGAGRGRNAVAAIPQSRRIQAAEEADLPASRQPQDTPPSEAPASTQRRPSQTPSYPETKAEQPRSSRGVQAQRRLSEHESGEEEHEPKLVSGRDEYDQSQFVITGRMTLRQVERETGISAGRILAKLGLPTSMPRNDTLGRLRRRYGFTLTEFREAIEALMEKK